jgi:hypothetical protein
MELLPDELRARLPPISGIDEEDEPYVFITTRFSATGQDWYAMAGGRRKMISSSGDSSGTKAGFAASSLSWKRLSGRRVKPWSAMKVLPKEDSVK